MIVTDIEHPSFRTVDVLARTASLRSLRHAIPEGGEGFGGLGLRGWGLGGFRVLGLRVWGFRV